MWGGIVALHGRYPTSLAELKDGWWKSEAHVETLCALVVWRQWIDAPDGTHAKSSTFQVQPLRLRSRSPPGRRRRHPRMEARSGTRRVALLILLSAVYACASSRIWRTGWRPSRLAVA